MMLWVGQVRGYDTVDGTGEGVMMLCVVHVRGYDTMGCTCMGL